MSANATGKARLVQEKAEAGHDKPKAHDGETGANPRKEGSFGCKEGARVRHVNCRPAFRQSGPARRGVVSPRLRSRQSRRLRSPSRSLGQLCERGCQRVNARVSTRADAMPPSKPAWIVISQPDFSLGVLTAQDLHVKV